MAGVTPTDLAAVGPGKVRVIILRPCLSAPRCRFKQTADTRAPSASRRFFFLFLDGWFSLPSSPAMIPSLAPTGWARQKIYNAQNYRQIFSFQLLNNVVWKTVTTLFTEHFAKRSTKCLTAAHDQSTERKHKKNMMFTVSECIWSCKSSIKLLCWRTVTSHLVCNSNQPPRPLHAGTSCIFGPFHGNVF